MDDLNDWEDDGLGKMWKNPVCTHITIICGACIQCKERMDVPHCNTPLVQKAINFTRFNLPEAVSERAAHISKQLRALNGPTKVRPVEITFFCVYSAYRELGVAIEARDVARKLHMTNYNLLDYNATGYQPKVAVFTALDMIGPICTSFSSMEHSTYEEIRALTRHILTLHPEMVDKPPKKLAAAIIQAYMDETLGGRKVGYKLSDVVDITDSTINIVVASVKADVAAYLSAK